jgi:hypothetical protein
VAGDLLAHRREADEVGEPDGNGIGHIGRARFAHHPAPGGDLEVPPPRVLQDLRHHREQHAGAHHRRLGQRGIDGRVLVDPLLDRVDLRRRDALHGRANDPRHLERDPRFDEPEVEHVVDVAQHLDVDVGEDPLVIARVWEAEGPPELAHLLDGEARVGRHLGHVVLRRLRHEEVAHGEQAQRAVGLRPLDVLLGDAEPLDEIAQRARARQPAGAHRRCTAGPSWATSAPRSRGADERRRWRAGERPVTLIRSLCSLIGTTPRQATARARAAPRP